MLAMAERAYRFLFVAVFFCIFFGAQRGAAELATSKQSFSQERAPRSDDSGAPGSPTGESSSKSTKIDLSPPPGEPDINRNEGAPQEENQPHYTWNPHKADKNVEIGDFYYKRKNYEAAISRYREALKWQDNHALATFHLAEALEQTGQYAAARQYYQQYLRILPRGEYARAAIKALERLKNMAGPNAGLPAHGRTGSVPRIN
jgi:tetratricopeptide (TPR) repeat protein